MKKTLAILLVGLVLLAALTGCSGTNDTITVVSREEGSGTRGAFVELMGIEEKNANGEKIDHTTDMAEITDKTSVMMTTVAGNVNAIGYVSLGSLNDSVKAVAIDGVAPTVDNVSNGTYKVSRPFNIATKGESTGITKDFVNFILSTGGQQVVDDEGYIAIDTDVIYTSQNLAGTITVGGSSSVSPVMEKLIEAYKTLNPNVTIELQTTDSTTGMTDTSNGTINIGMASRELKDSEISSGLVGTVIAKDGIAVIVNKENAVTGLTSEQVKSIFTGEVTAWSQVNN